MRWLRHPLTLIVAIHVALGLAFGLATPIFEAPDEANHFLFIRYLQLNRALPVQTLDQNGPRAHHPPLYFLAGALVSAWVPDAGGAERIEVQENPNLWFRYGDPATDHKAKLIHAPEEGWPYRGQSLAVHVIRLLSTAFSALAVAFTYLAAGELLPARPLAASLAAALLAFNPMVLFMSGVVQNSTAVLASSAVLVYALSRWQRQGFTPFRWLWIGVSLSGAVLIQTSGLTLAAPVGLALAYEAWRARRVRRLIASSLACGLPALALTGWWFVRNQRLYGDWTANAIVAALWSDQPIMPLEQTWHLLATGMVGRFGFGLIVEYAAVIYRSAWLLAVGAALGLVRLAFTALRRRNGFRLNDEAVLWAMHVLTVVGVAAALGAYILWYIRGGHGRYMFTAYPSLAVLLAAGALAWFPARRSVVIAFIGAGLSLGLSAYGLFGLVIPAYAPPRAPTSEELRTMTPLDASIGGVARVLGYRLTSAQVQPGETLEVSVYWQPEARTGTPYTIFVQLLQPGVGLVAQQDTYPGRGNWATTAWDTGRPFVEAYRLQVPETAEAFDHARLVLGLYDVNTLQRLPVTGASAGSAEEAWVQFGDVRIGP
jgi:hypothetical protein